MDPDPDPGGPKTCGSGGSGSGTLLLRIKSRHLNPRGGEVGNLKLDTDGRLALVEISDHAGQTEVGFHEIFLTTREGLDCPDDGVLLRRIFAMP